jgi:hypothetical protein
MRDHFDALFANLLDNPAARGGCSMKVMVLDRDAAAAS